MKVKRNWWIAGGLVLLALLVRAAIFINVNGFDIHSQVAFRLEPDAAGYDRLAINIWQHGVFSMRPGPPLVHDTLRTPVYPVFLAGVYALVGHYPAAALVAQLVVASLASGLTFLAGRELGLRAGAALLAGLAVALDPLSALTANLMFTDTVFATLLIAMLWTLAHWRRHRGWRWLLVAAVFLSLAALTRPIAQFLPLAIAGWIIFAMRVQVPRVAWPRVVACALVVLVVCGGMIGSWAFTNYQQREVFTVSTIGTTNLLYWRAADVLARIDGTTRREAEVQLRDEVQRLDRERDLSFAERVSLEQSMAVGILRNHPLLVLRQAVAGVVTLLVGPSMTPACLMLSPNVDRAACTNVTFASLPLIPKLTVIWSVLLLGGVYLSAAAGAISLARRGAWDVLALLVVVIVYFMVLSAGPEAYSRMRIPFFPMLALLAGFGLQSILARGDGEDRFSRLRRSRPVEA